MKQGLDKIPCVYQPLKKMSVCDDSPLSGQRVISEHSINYHLDSWTILG